MWKGNMQNVSEENLYSLLMEKNPNRFALAALSITIMMLSIITSYSIIWIERFGSDKKRTVINQMVSSMCWTFITWNCTVQVLKLIRFLHGPLSERACQWFFILQRTLTTRLLLLVNAISIVRYAFIFWFKNPGVLNDDFWHRFINLWTMMAGSFLQYAIVSLPNVKIIGFDVCVGSIPITDIDSPPINIGVEVPTLILQVVIFACITKYKRHLKNKPQQINVQQSSQLVEIEKFSLLTFSSNIGVGMLVVILLSIILTPSKFDVGKIFIFPYSFLFIFKYLIFPSLVSFVIPLSLYFYHPHVRKTIVRELQSSLISIREKIC